MYILRIITFFITITFISVVSCELPTPDDFIVMCNLKNKYFIATELKTMLDNADYDDRVSWLSNFNDKCGSPLIYAISINNLPVVEIIIQSMIQQDIKYHEFSISNGKSLLVFATIVINYRLIDILLNYNHPINIGYGANKTSALHEAAKLGDISLCKRFINDKSSFLLHVEDYEKYTPINYLIQKKVDQMFIVTLLQKYPIDKNNLPLDHEGMNYMYYAVSYKLPYVVETLLELGLEPEKQLLTLAEDKNDFVIKKLLEHKVMTTPKTTNNCFQCFCYKKKLLN